MWYFWVCHVDFFPLMWCSPSRDLHYITSCASKKIHLYIFLMTGMRVQPRVFALISWIMWSEVSWWSLLVSSTFTAFMSATSPVSRRDLPRDKKKLRSPKASNGPSMDSKRRCLWQEQWSSSFYLIKQCWSTNSGATNAMLSWWW